MVLCFDIGGTSIKYGLAHAPDGTVEFPERWETPTDAKALRGPGVERKLLDLIGGLRGKYDFAGVAVSTAGVVDPKTGAILYANENIPEYTGRNLKTAVEAAFCLPCVVENDVNCAALGEAAYGAGRGADSVFCLTVGTGVGGAAVLGGAVWHGHAGAAGEVGYLPMGGGAFETQASVTALIRRVADETGQTLDGRQIFARAQAGDAVCAWAIEAMCTSLARGIACCVCVLDPESVVLGGGVMTQRAYLRPLLERELARLAVPPLRHTRLAFAELGNSAGMAGAFRLLERIL